MQPRAVALVVATYRDSDFLEFEAWIWGSDPLALALESGSLEAAIAGGWQAVIRVSGSVAEFTLPPPNIQYVLTSHRQLVALI